jgi:hypothetical protein
MAEKPSLGEIAVLLAEYEGRHAPISVENNGEGFFEKCVTSVGADMVGRACLRLRTIMGGMGGYFCDCLGEVRTDRYPAAGSSIADPSAPHSCR